MIYKRSRAGKSVLAIITCLMMTAFSSCGSGTQSDVPPELVGSWEVGGIYYNARLIDVNDVEGLADYAENQHLTINEDGSFVYLNSVFGNKGSVKAIEGEGTVNYLLDSDETFMYEYENGEIAQKPTTEYNEPKKYLAVPQDEYTMEVYEYDAAMGKVVAGKDPTVFVMSGKDSEFIANNKFAINGNKNSSSSKPDTDSSTDKTAKPDGNTDYGGGSYQSILDEYTAKMENAVPGLVDEYRSEASGTSDITRKAEICNEKVSKLAEICNEGVSEMAELMQKNGDSYDTYEKWAGKLMDNYTEIANDIQDAYLDSAM